MTPKARPLTVAAAVLFTFVNLVASLWLSYLAGCAGDTKGGALGDPVRALELEGQSLLPSLLSLFSGTALLFIFSRGTAAKRTAVAIAFFVFSGAALFYLGIQFEVWGIKSCFS